MKKITIAFFGILILAGTVSASFFYFQKSKGVAAQTTDTRLQTPSAGASIAKFQVAGGQIKILFLGDLMFDRWIRQVSETKGGDFVFQKVESLLGGEDLVVGNLEGPITDKASISVNSDFGSADNYVFTFPPLTAADLSKENIKLVNLGNNHILNQGAAGLADTENFLDAAKVNYFGDPQNQAARIKLYAAGGVRIAFVNYDQFMANAAVTTLADIHSAKAQGADIVILYTHWGTEFVAEPEQKIKNLAHQFIDAGADLIIGSHPHVIQTKEIYKGKTIYYSLGNFIFDQYFSPETQKGMGVEASIEASTKKISLREYNFSLLKSGQTVIQN